MHKTEQFFLYCSGVEASILARCASDRNKYVGIGATIFFTGLLAFFSSGYALYTVFESYPAAFVFGLVWGTMIFNLDRYIVMSMKSYGKWYRDLLVALPRVGLAVLLALVISKPLEMKVFEKEIEAELVVMEQEVFKSQEDKVQARFQGEIEDYTAQIAVLKAELAAKAAQRDTLTLRAVQEADGTGGSREKNLGPIYKAKRAEADKAQAELDQAVAASLPLIQEKENAIAAVKKQLDAEKSGLQKARYNGLAARMEALSRMSAKSHAMMLASLFLMLLFIAIETAPILVKLISYRSPYDYLLHEHEHVFEMANLESTTMRSHDVRQKLRYNTEVGAHLVQSKITAEKALIDQKLKENLEGLKSKPFDWKMGSFDGV
jgi:Domain of unknown function (DUF4407)